MNTLSVALGLACLGGAAVVGGASPAGARTELEAMVRPIALPFLWRSLGDASRAGDPAEAFAKAQLLLEAIPGWADGYIVFAYRYALDGGDVALPPAARERAAADRLQIGLSVLDRARASCQRDEIDLLVSMSWLVELAVRREPGIAPLLGTAPAVLADGFLVAAEARGAGRMVREQRLFQLPQLVAALLAAGDRARALDLLDEGVARCAEVRRTDIATEWRALLDAVRRCLRGDPTVDGAALLADDRLQPLATFLR